VAHVIVSPHILAVRFGSLGDILLATPLFRAIRQRHPGVRITVLTRRRFAPLLADNPRIDEVIGVAPDQSLPSVAAWVRRSRFSHLLDLEGSPRTWLLRFLAPGHWRCAPRYLAARELLIRTKHNRYPEDVPLPERYFDAARELDVVPDGGPPELFLSPDAEEQADRWLGQAGVGRDRPFVAFAPGAAHATKRWPAEYWVQLVRRVVATGADGLLVGGPDDTMLAAEVASRSGTRTVSLAGVLGLQTSGAVLKRAAALVTGHTGAMHIATAVGTPLVALFGPTVRAFGYHPYNAPRAMVLERNLDCRPCSRDGGDSCPFGHHRCLREIQPDAVFAALCRLLS
jgi:heptosyltransferase-2